MVSTNTKIDILVLHLKTYFELIKESHNLYGQQNSDYLSYIDKYGNKIRIIRSLDLKEEEIIVY